MSDLRAEPCNLTDLLVIQAMRNMNIMQRKHQMKSIDMLGIFPHHRSGLEECFMYSGSHVHSACGPHRTQWRREIGFIQTNFSGIVAVERLHITGAKREWEREFWGLSCSAGNLQSVNIWRRAQRERDWGGGIEKHERLSAAREKDARMCNLNVLPALRQNHKHESCKNEP